MIRGLVVNDLRPTKLMLIRAEVPTLTEVTSLHSVIRQADTSF